MRKLARWLVALAAIGCGTAVTWKLARRAEPVRSAPAASVTPAAPSFPLAPSENSRYLVDARGRPFLLHGDTAWDLIAAVDPAGVRHYLDDRARRGVRALLVELVESPDFGPPANYAGHRPFLATLAGGKLDLGAPNDAYFRHADFVVEEASKRGIAVLLFPLYLGYQGGNEGLYAHMLENGAGRVRRYGAYVGARYGKYPNVVWVLGGDYLPPATGLALVAELAAGIESAQPEPQLFSAHWGPDQSSHEARQPWLDLDYAYAYEPNAPYREVLEGYRTRPALPVFLGESRYERHASNPPALQIRRQAYGALLSGACGQFLGNEVVWRFQGDWRAELDSDGARDMQRLGALFGALRWHELEPDSESVLVTDGRGAFGDVDYVTAARTRDGRLALAYVPAGQAIRVALGRLGVPQVRARFFDPTSARFEELGALRADGERSFAPPGKNSVGDPDWLLLLEAQP